MTNEKESLIVFEAILYSISTGANDLNKYILQNIEVLNNLSIDEKTFLKETIENTLRNTESWKIYPHRNRFLVVILQQLLFKIETINSLTAELINCETYSEKIDSFWKLFAQLFYWNMPETEQIANEAFKYLIQLAQPSLPKLIDKNPTRSSIDVLIVVQQFLPGNHAPSLEVKDYAKVLISLGRNVEILITNEMLGRMDKLWPNRINCNDDIIGKHILKFDGYNVHALGLKQDQSIENITSTIKHYAEVKPNLIISIGTHCIYSELLGNYSKLITMPTNAGFHYSMNSDFIIWFSGEKSKVEKIRNQYQLVKPKILTDINYQYITPQTIDRVERSDLKLNIHHKIGVVVGNRLDNDIDEEFMDFLALLVKSKNISIIIVGELGGPKMARLNAVGAESISFIKYHPNLVDLFSAVDFFLNPKRLGGGTTAAHALSAGLLVFSLRFGDVANLTLAEHTFTDYVEMETIIDILEDDDLFQKYRDKSKQKFTEISNRKYLIQNLLELAGVNDV